MANVNKVKRKTKDQDRNKDTVGQLISNIVGRDKIVLQGEINPDYTHDESLTAIPVLPLCVVYPKSTSEVQQIMKIANSNHIPVVPRGSGTGLSGACIPLEDGILISFEKMNNILEIDTENHVAVVQPGVTLKQLDDALLKTGLMYPVFPGENSASIGGNIATNAGGMRAVKYGVTRHHVLGLEVVLPTAKTVSTGGKFVKSSSGYSLTQLMVGSEGTLALITKAILKLTPRIAHNATVLAPFDTLKHIASAIPKVLASGIGPAILEYIDSLTMAAITQHAKLDFAIPQQLQDAALAYLVTMLENNDPIRLNEDVEKMCALLLELGAKEVFVLPPKAATKLVEAREKAFWVAKQHKANEIIDVVVPRACIPNYLTTIGEIAQKYATFIAGCGHVGDGNVHLSLFQSDNEKLHDTLKDIFKKSMDMGGAISGEHGIGSEKKPYFLELEDPHKIDLMRRIKASFDPNWILNPNKLIDQKSPLDAVFSYQELTSTTIVADVRTDQI